MVIKTDMEENVEESRRSYAGNGFSFPCGANAKVHRVKRLAEIKYKVVTVPITVFL